MAVTADSWSSSPLAGEGTATSALLAKWLPYVGPGAAKFLAIQEVKTLESIALPGNREEMRALLVFRASPNATINGAAAFLGALQSFGQISQDLFILRVSHLP